MEWGRQTMVDKTPHSNIKIEQDEPIKKGGKQQCPGRVSRSCLPRDTRRLNVKQHENHPM